MAQVEDKQAQGPQGPYSWPSRKDSKVIGKDHERMDGIEKSTGAAKYTYDVNLKNQLIAKALGSPHAHCRINGIDTTAAEKVPGVVDVHILPHAEAGSEIKWQGELLAIVSAESEGAAAEGVDALKVDYEVLDSFTSDSDLKGAEEAGVTARGGGKVQTINEPGDDDDEDEWVDAEIERIFKESKHVVEGYYGIDAITHCCLEPHGSTVAWEGDKLKAYLSTQNVSGTDEGFANDLEISADSVDVECTYVGGGFGSKFAPDYWGIAAARISKRTGRPVKLMLSRDQELKLGGNRPSGYLQVKLGADADGVVQVWDSHHWGTSGVSGSGVSHTVVPYVLVPPNYRRKATAVRTNLVRARAWRAPNHPQACAITQTAIDDLAATMGKDSYDVFMANLVNANNEKADVYTEEMKIGAKLIDWKAKWHPHGKGERNGSIVEGLGMALHTWGGVANTSECTVKIHPDGGVSSFCGTQDIGSGTKTVCAMVLAETLGLSTNQVTVNYGSSTYPFSGASGGSTTVGAVSESHRRAGTDALTVLKGKVAEKIGADAGTLVASDGRIHVAGNKDKGLGWKEACGLLGLKPLEITRGHTRGDASPLSNSGVGGVQMAHVCVDLDTGVVKMKEFVAVQDQGLVINPVTCKSQIYGAVIMGIAAALYEQRIADPATGALLNAELADYQLARLGDIGNIKIELYEPESERQRGVIGNGEPPAISPVAAISNAVANAIGARVSTAPYTPQRVLEALKNA